MRFTLNVAIVALATSSLLSGVAGSQLVERAVAGNGGGGYSSTDVCGDVNSVLKVPSKHPYGGQYTNVGTIRNCLCASNLPYFVSTNSIATAAVSLAGGDYVTSALRDMINGCASPQTCQYPQHSVPSCRSDNPCGFDCKDGYTPYPSAYPTQCVCNKPNRECNGKCGDSYACPNNYSKRDEQYGGPHKQHGGQYGQHGGQHGQHGGKHEQHGGKHEQHGGKHAGHDGGHHGSQQEYPGGQHGHHEGQQGHHGGQYGDHLGKRGDYGGQQGHHGGQKHEQHGGQYGQHEGQQGHHGDQHEHHEGQQGHHGDQHEHHEDQQGHHGGQYEHHEGQQGHHGSQYDDYLGKREHHDGSKGHHGGQQQEHHGGQQGHHGGQQQGHHGGQQGHHGGQQGHHGGQQQHHGDQQGHHGGQQEHHGDQQGHHGGQQEHQWGKRDYQCRAGLTACGVYGRGAKSSQCVDTRRDLKNCGGCTIPLSGYGHGRAGQDCTALRGVSEVSCDGGRCVVRRCNTGYGVHQSGSHCEKHSGHQGHNGGPYSLEK